MPRAFASVTPVITAGSDLVFLNDSSPYVSGVPSVAGWHSDPGEPTSSGPDVDTPDEHAASNAQTNPSAIVDVRHLRVFTRPIVPDRAGEPSQIERISCSRHRS